MPTTVPHPSRGLDVFARAIADGVNAPEAWARAGFHADADVARARAAAPDVARRIAALRGAAEPDAEPRAMIARCLTLADEAARLGSAAGMMAAHRFIAEAARLAHVAPPGGQAHGADEAPALPPLLSDDEWLAKYAPAA